MAVGITTLSSLTHTHTHTHTEGHKQIEALHLSSERDRGSLKRFVAAGTYGTTKPCAIVPAHGLYIYAALPGKALIVSELETAVMWGAV